MEACSRSLKVASHGALVGFLAFDETKGWVVLAYNLLKQRGDAFAVGRGVWQVNGSASLWEAPTSKIGCTLGP
jgi:hypothetical protein